MVEKVCSPTALFHHAFGTFIGTLQVRWQQRYEIEKEFSKPGTMDGMIEEKELAKGSYNNSDYLLPGYSVL